MTGMLARADRKFPELREWMQKDAIAPTPEQIEQDRMKVNLYLAAALSGGTVTTRAQREAAEAAEKNQGSV